MKLTLLTLFPEFFSTPFSSSILKRATAAGSVEFNVINIRDFAIDKHQMTDDRPYGGGPGMVMKVDPIYAALQNVLGVEPELHKVENLKKDAPSTRVILTSAKGKVFTQASAQSYSTLEHLVIICGHYEGVDERVAEHLIDEEVRIGDYVLTGGEPAALVMADAVTRLLPGVLGNEDSNQDESHSVPGQLGHPQYTRPEVFNTWKVPEILLEGHHAKITAWRNAQKLRDESPRE
jgi:tRNA (guanine37-N1)-methyltransferase